MSRPQLGVNFEPFDLADPPVYAQPAIRALRPAIVRQIVTRGMDVGAWIQAAALARVRVVWCIAPDRISLREAIVALLLVLEHGAHVTEAVEIGWAPWRFPNYAPRRFAYDALLLLAETEHLAPEVRRLLGLGLEVQSFAASTAWIRRFLDLKTASALGRLAPTVALADRYICRPWPNVNEARYLARLLAPAFPGGITFTSVACPIGQPLSRWARLLEAMHCFAHDEPRIPHTDRVTPEMRRRWLVKSYKAAAGLGVHDYLLDASDVGAPGVGRWGLYHPDSERPDPAWYALQWAVAPAGD